VTFFLRDRETGETVAECDVFIDHYLDKHRYVDAVPTVDVRAFACLLLKAPASRLAQLIKDFEDIQDIRGYVHERLLMHKRNTEEEFDFVATKVRELIKDVCSRHSDLLYYVED